MKISEARYSGGELILSTRDAGAKRFALTFKAGEYELTRTKQKRSLDANAYYWQLCGQLAKAVNIEADEIYRRHIKDMSNYEVYLMQDKAVEAFRGCGAVIIWGAWSKREKIEPRGGQQY